MPENLEQLDAEVDKEAEAIRQTRLGGLQGAVPPGAEPLTADSVNGLADAVEAAVPKLSGGQVTAEDLRIPRVDGEVDRVPPELGAQVLTAAAFADTSGLADGYQFDPTELLRTNAGLDEAAEIITGMASDPKVLKAVGGGEPEAAPESEPTDEEPEFPAEEG